MRGWIAGYHINGFVLDVVKDFYSANPQEHPLEGILDALAAGGRVLVVVDETELELGDRSIFKQLLDESERAFNDLLPRVVLSKMPTYASAFFAQATLDDPQRKLLERDDFDVFDSESALAMVRKMGPDEEKLADFYKLEYAEEYKWTMDCITECLTKAVQSEQKVFAHIEGNPTDLLLGIPKPPDKEILANESLLSKPVLRFGEAIDEYGDANAEAKKTLQSLKSAWQANAATFAELFVKNHPELTRTMTVEEIIETMLLTHAKEAYDAGVPISDIFC